MSIDTPSAIPAELRTRKQWLTWQNVDGRKIPNGKSNCPTTWSDYSEIEIYDNVAFVFDGDDPFTGIDLDDCIVDGEFTKWSKPILDKFRGVAYGEVSPSGAGVKLTTIGKKPNGSRCVCKIGQNKQQIECYDHARFWTVTGNVLDGFETIGDGQDAVDWLCSTYLAGETRKTGERRTEAYNGKSPFDLLKRAQAYCDKMEPASKGGLRNAAFRNAGHLHAIVGSDGERLSDNDVYHLLRSWNARNSDPLRDDELHDAAASGRRNGTPPADKLPRNEPPQANGVCLDGFEEDRTNDATTRQSAIDLLDRYAEKLLSGNLPQLIDLPEPLKDLEVGEGLVTIVGAPPGVGKSAIAQQIMFDALSLNPGLTAVIANAEMTFDALMRRELTRLTRLDSKMIRFGKFDDLDRQSIKSAIAGIRPKLDRVSVLERNDLANLMLLVDEEPGLVVVDYLQKFAPPEMDARIGVNAVMAGLRKLAIAGWAVLCLSATKRDQKGKHDAKSLDLSSFRESGEVEYNADSAYVMQDLGPIDQDLPSLRNVTLGHVKNRHGEKVNRDLVFNMPKMQFSAPAPIAEPFEEFYEFSTDVTSYEEASF